MRRRNGILPCGTCRPFTAWLGSRYGFYGFSIAATLGLRQGLPGLAFCIQLAQMGARFLMRVKESFYVEEFGSVTKDGWITLGVTKRRAQKLVRTGNPLPVGTVLRLRVIKIPLANGSQEILMTNVPATLLPYEQVAAVHHLRWGVETHYDILKNDGELENFSGIRPEGIAQEHQATVVTSNMAALVEHEAQRRWEKRRARGEVRRKHAKDKINTSVAVGLWKDRWIKIVLDPDPNRRTQAYWHLVESMQANAVPVIPDRSYPRKPKLRGNQYSPKKRRSV